MRQRAASSIGRTRLEKWATFATVAGGAAAGLTGLLFVAVSIRVDVIAKSQELRTRAAQTLALFVTVLFIAVLLSIPDQAQAALGSELIALGLLNGGVNLALNRRALSSPAAGGTERDVAVLLDAVAPNAVTSILTAIAGILLVAGVDAGLDVLVLPVLFALAGGVWSAWLLLTKILSSRRARLGSQPGRARS